MEKFYLKKEYRYLIYGASVRGKEMLKGLKAAGYCVTAFLDRRAEDLKIVNGIPVYHPEKFEHNDFENTIIIVSISNPFEHTMIADYLHSFGYEKIIYAIFPGMDHTNEEISELDQTYANIQDGTVTEQNVFFQYTDQWMDLIFKDGACIQKDDKFVVAYLPIDMCFMSLRDYYYNFFGKAIMDNSPEMEERFNMPVYMAAYEQHNMFKAFYGTLSKRGKVIKAFTNFWKNNLCIYGDTFSRTPEGEEAMLINRCNAFWGMFQAYQRSGMDYFIQHPVEVYWNTNGYFNCVDGGHRISFLLAMGLSFVPALISNHDYAQWINKEKLRDCIDFAKEKHIPAAYAPIPHPHFRFFPAYRDIGGATRIHKIEEVLMYNHIQIKDSRILDAGSYYCYLSQVFARMGAKVTAIEYNLISSEFGRLLNELLYCSSIHSICCGLDEMDTKDRFSFTIMLTVLYPYINDPLGMKILHNIDIVTENFMIWESGDRPEDEIHFILENSSFKTYVKISETFGTGKLREIGIFCKEHIQMNLPEWFDSL